MERGWFSLIKKIYLKYKSLPISDESGGPQIYVLAAMAIFLLLGFFAAFTYGYKFQLMATRLHSGIKTAAVTALGDNSVTNPDTGGVQIVDQTATKQELMDNLQGQLQNWPQSTYTLTSFQCFSETDKGSTPPSGFAQPIPGTSIYLNMNLNLGITPGFMPISAHWSIPLYVMVSPNAYESATGAWNLAR